MVGRLRTAIVFDRRMRLLLVGLACSLLLLGGGWLLIRHSSLVSVEHVSIGGVSGPQAPAIERALTDAARGMSTMDVSGAALRASVARFPVVQRVRAEASFPHTLHLSVLEQQPVATLVVSGMKTALAADGVALGPELLRGSLPTLTSHFLPARGQHLHDASLLESLSLLGAAPPAIETLVARVYVGPRGLTAAMKSGLLVYFGDASRPHAKWLSLASVLAEHSSGGALYVDVRLPDRPAAGMTAEAPAGSTSTSSSPSPAGAQESTVSALAAGLKGEKAEAPKEPENASGGSAGTGSANGEPAPAGEQASGGEGHSESSAESSSATTAGSSEASG